MIDQMIDAYLAAVKKSRMHVSNTRADERASVMIGLHAALNAVADDPVAYLRDLDGTGSLHPCGKNDPGAFPVYFR